jgi:pimeloyl-ACP methyl ester carboxylesterase
MVSVDTLVSGGATSDTIVQLAGIDTPCICVAAPTTGRNAAMPSTRVTRLVGLLALSLASAGALRAQVTTKPTIVLVHGAFADGTGWQRVIAILQRDGYPVLAVQNPLVSFAADVQTTKRLIDAQKGPVVAVGHSYGGAVITEAAAGNANVKALVYIAAFAPEAGEPIGAFLERYPTALGPALRPDAAGFLYVDRARFRDIFAADVPAADANVMAAAQKPIIGAAFGASVGRAAWKSIPSWYLVAQDDRAISPELERFYARRMRATTTEVRSSHVPFVSRPGEVARVIVQAASAAAKYAAK